MFFIVVSIWVFVANKNAALAAANANITQQCIDDTKDLRRNSTITTYDEYTIYDQNKLPLASYNVTDHFLVFSLPHLYNFVDFLDFRSPDPYVCHGKEDRLCGGELGLECNFFYRWGCCTYDAMDEARTYKQNCTQQGGQYDDINITIACIERKTSFHITLRFWTIPMCIASSCDLEAIRKNYTMWFQEFEPFVGFEALEYSLSADGCDQGFCYAPVCATKFGEDAEVSWCKDEESVDFSETTPTETLSAAASVARASSFSSLALSLSILFL